jgi:putative oxidoreductase
MRLVAGSVVIDHGLARLRTGSTIEPAIVDVLAIAAGILLLAGLWTLISGTLVAGLGFWSAISVPGDVRTSILLGTIGTALALIGPGAWSVDARLFGWKRIHVRNRKT